MEIEVDIERHFTESGYMEFPGIVSGQAIKRINAGIDLYRDDKQGYSGLVDQQAAEFISILREEARFKQIEKVARNFVTTLTSSWFPASRVVTKDLYVLRCVDSKGERVSNLRHFDSHYMTLLIPVRSADSDTDDIDNGDLILYPIPSMPTGSGSNFLRKTVNKLDQKLPVEIRRRLTQTALDSGRAIRVRSKVGSVYFFNGLVTKHCNLAVAHGERRSLLIHDYAPNLSFGVAESLVSLRRWITKPN